MKDKTLFSPDPRLRWKHAKEYAEAKGKELDKEITARYKDWPCYWFGAANAWLVFLGPSPGDSGGRTIDWPKEKYPTLGKPHGLFSTYVDSTGFWRRLREWTIEAYRLADVFQDDKEASFGVTLLANVLDTNVGAARKIKDASLAAAMPRVVDNLELVRPRIIVPMEKRVSRLLIEEFRKRGAVIIAGPSQTLVRAKKQRYQNYKPWSWCLQTDFGQLLVAEAPQHPSKKNFYEPKTIDDYLAQKIKMCLNAA